jgi:hypothetical protein
VPCSGTPDKCPIVMGEVCAVVGLAESKPGFASMSGRIDELRHELKVARTLGESSAQKALADIETKIEKLTAELNKIQALDLRWAIGGLFISAIGTFLGYWA